MGRRDPGIAVVPWRGLVVLVTVLAAVVVATSAVAGTRALTEVRTTEAAVLNRINQVRSAHGLRALRLSSGLDRAAGSHARSMGRRGFFSHTSKDGTSMGRRIARFYPQGPYARWTVGEALAWRSPGGTAAAIVRMWLRSPVHRHILLHGAFREIGIAAIHADRAPGVYGGRPATIFVADFGARS
jgi:uncharacterized protein YkwD